MEHSAKRGAALSNRGAWFEVFLATDRNLKYQQRLTERTLAIVVLLSTTWPKIRANVDKVAASVESATPGSYFEVTF